MITSVLSLAYQASNPAVYEVVRKPGTNVFRRRSRSTPRTRPTPGLLLVRVEGRIFFGNTERVLDLVAPLVAAASPRVIVLDCSAIFDLEYSALKMLAEADERVRGHGAELWLAALNPDARRVVERRRSGRRSAGSGCSSTWSTRRRGTASAGGLTGPRAGVSRRILLQAP